MTLSCFKAYDIRGRVPDELNERLAYDLGLAYASEYQPKTVVIGYDIRESSPLLHEALSKGLQEGGADVISLGLCGTEEVYFQTSALKASGGIMITASHNPIDYNGMKLVREEGVPISSDTGLVTLSERIEKGLVTKSNNVGNYSEYHDKSHYIDHLLSYIDCSQLKPLKIVVNAGNGCAGPIVDLLEPHLPFDLIKVHNVPDGTFPNGIPNPLLPECREDTKNAVLKHSADIGVAWDGDFDRCFFFDHTGRFIESYYLVGLLAQQLLEKHPGQKIIIDPRLTWNSEAQVLEAGGETILSKSGHAFMKQKLRDVNAIYGGEMSAHHYFKAFSYCDSGMIPWLLIAELISQSGRSLADWVDERIKAFPCSGEINFKVQDSAKVIEKVFAYFRHMNPVIDQLDGVSISFDNWRFNLRTSNTEPLIRLNVETKRDEALLNEKVILLKRLISS